MHYKFLTTILRNMFLWRRICTSDDSKVSHHWFYWKFSARAMWIILPISSYFLCIDNIPKLIVHKWTQNHLKTCTWGRTCLPRKLYTRSFLFYPISLSKGCMNNFRLYSTLYASTERTLIFSKTISYIGIPYYNVGCDQGDWVSKEQQSS